MQDNKDDDPRETGIPVTQLAEFTDETDPRLTGRVHRDINRRVLAADALDLGFNGLLMTFWDYFRALLEALRAPGADDTDPKTEEPTNG